MRAICAIINIGVSKMLPEEKILYDWVNCVFSQTVVKNELALHRYITDVLQCHLREQQMPWMNFAMMDAKLMLGGVLSDHELRPIAEHGLVQQVIFGSQAGPAMHKVVREIYSRLAISPLSVNRYNKIDRAISVHYHEIILALSLIGGNYNTSADNILGV